MSYKGTKTTKVDVLDIGNTRKRKESQELFRDVCIFDKRKRKSKSSLSKSGVKEEKAHAIRCGSKGKANCEPELEKDLQGEMLWIRPKGLQLRGEREEILTQPHKGSPQYHSEKDEPRRKSKGSEIPIPKKTLKSLGKRDWAVRNNIETNPGLEKGCDKRGSPPLGHDDFL